MTAPAAQDDVLHHHHQAVSAMAVIPSGSADAADTPAISSRCIIPIEASLRYLPKATAEAMIVTSRQQDEERGGSVVTQVIASSIIGGGQDANGNVRSAAYSRREAELLSATILLKKPSQQSASLGIQFKDQGGKVLISSLLDTSEDGTPFLLSHSPFKVGDEILSINGTKCAGMDTPSVIQLLRQEHGGTLTILARRPTGDSALVETMIEKPSRDSGLGIAIKRNDRGVLKVSKMARDGLFAHSLLNAGDTVLAVNQVDCHGLDATDTVGIMRNAERYVTVMTETLHTKGVVVAVGATAQEPNIPTALARASISDSPKRVESPFGKEGRRAWIICGLFMAFAAFYNLQVFLRRDEDS